MRVILRIGLLLGLAGGVALFGIAQLAPVALHGGIVAVGILAGLATAKWLPWSWYGRQTAAGIWSGALACALAAGGALAAQVAPVVPRGRALTPPALAAALANSPLAAALLPLAVLAGIALSAVVARVLAGSKSARMVEVVARAEERAQAMQRAAPAAMRAPASMPPASGLWQSPAMATGAPAPIRATGMAPRTPLPFPHATRGEPELAATPQLEDEPLPEGDPLEPRRASPSDARSVDSVLTDEMREALDVWAKDNLRKRPSKRKPKASAYLNSTPPDPKRDRKAQDTRDWLC